VVNLDLNSLNLFVKVVQKGSFSAAAKFTGVPVATISRRVSELELSLDLRLLERSTRQLRLTEAGSTLFEFATRAVEEIEAGELALQEREGDIRGKLRLSAPPNFEPWWPLIRQFQNKYPNVQVDLFVSERKVELIEDGIDVALRIGELVHQSAVVRKLYTYRHVLVATPEFIQHHGRPQTPAELSKFPCAVWSSKNSEPCWSLGGQKIHLQAYIKANDFLHMRYLALRHDAITELPPFLAKAWLDSGEFVEILPEFPLPNYDVSLIYPSRKQISRVSRVYIDFCVENAAKYL
jgi:DNA-binding transcriptional LysR family regulator